MDGLETLSGVLSASAGKYVVLGKRLVFGRHSFTVAGPSIWNTTSDVSKPFNVKYSCKTAAG